jgi:hypothetical protein
MWHIWDRRQILTEFCLGNLKEGNYLEGLGVDGMLILKLFLRKESERAFSGFIWLRIGTSGGFL